MVALIRIPADRGSTIQSIHVQLVRQGRVARYQTNTHTRLEQLESQLDSTKLLADEIKPSSSSHTVEIYPVPITAENQDEEARPSHAPGKTEEDRQVKLIISSGLLRLEAWFLGLPLTVDVIGASYTFGGIATGHAYSRCQEQTRTSSRRRCRPSFELPPHANLNRGGCQDKHTG